MELVRATERRVQPVSSTKSLNPFRNPWRILAIFTVTVVVPFALFALAKIGPNADLLTRPAPGVVIWNPVEQDPAMEHAWICRQLASLSTPSINQIARYNTECK